MDPLGLVLGAGALIAGTGVLALILFRAPRLSTSIAIVGAVAGSAVGLFAAVSTLRFGFTAQLSAPWVVPGGGLVVGVDPLSAFFLAPLFVVGALSAVYGRSYLGPLPAQGAEFNLLLATMTLVLIARHGLLFLVAWEAMTLLAFLLITFDHGEAEVRRAGWTYLIASHIGVMAMVALFLALAARAGGSLDFTSITEAWRTHTFGAAGTLLLALVGFGTKAGVVGFHVWLPEAHAAAPSHVSALMSAVLIKLGLYGLLRTTLFVSPGAWFGVLLMILGVVGALLGITLALAQRDLKRVLAYSSVENIGIILLGLGLGFWARARGHGPLAALAFGGALLHIWNHAAMKGLMFLGAGSVLHGTGTKDVERLGGLLRRMRWTGRAMILGSVAMAGLPPLNGFTGEWLLYRALTEVGISERTPSNLLAMAAAAALALAGGLAALCFVRLVGIVLLGTPRGDGAAHAHESPAPMTASIWILCGACVVGAISAPALVSAQASVLAELRVAGGPDVAAASSHLAPLALVNLVLLLAIALATVLVTRRVGNARLTETWGCGYAAPAPRAQYSARGFSEFVTRRALPRWLRAQVCLRPLEPPPQGTARGAAFGRPIRLEPPPQGTARGAAFGRPIRLEGVFPAATVFASDVADPLTRKVYEPLLVRTGDHFARLRFLQQGNLNIYLLYLLAAVIGGLTWVAVRDWSTW